MEQFIQVCGSTMSNTAKEKLNGLTEALSSVIIKKVKKMATVATNGPKGTSIQASGKII